MQDEHATAAVNSSSSRAVGFANSDAAVPTAATTDRITAALMQDDLLLLQESLDRYEVLDRIDRGGQGVVYRARQKGAERPVALKVLLDGPLATERQRFRFEREIELVSRLRHPNIITLYDSGTVRGRLFYAMEFVEGLAIDDYTVLQDLSPRAIVTLMVRVCRAIHFAHQNGVIHRDLKPDHIVVGEDGEPRVFDFGLAKDLFEQDADPRHSCTGQVIGTLPYLSPEQAGGLDGRADVRSDVYALGVILYHLMTDLFPYEVVGPSEQVRRNIVATEALPLRKAIALSESDRAPRLHEINRDLEAVLAKALAKRKEERYQSAAELADDLERYLAGAAVSARAASAWYVVRKTLRKHRVAFGVMAAFGLLAIGATVAVSVAWMEARKQNALFRTALHSAQDQYGFALGVLEEQVRPLPGGVAVCDSLVNRLGDQLAGLEALAGSDPSMSAYSLLFMEKQADNAMEHGQRDVAAAQYARLIGQLEPRAGQTASDEGLLRLACLYWKHADALDDFEEGYRAAVACAERVWRTQPKSDNARFELCRALVAHGLYLNGIGRESDALEVFDRAGGMIPDADNPQTSAAWLRQAANVHGGRGKALLAIGCGEQGMDEYHRALALRGRIVREYRADTNARWELMRSCTHTARAERERGESSVAAKLFAKAVDTGKELAELDPTSTRWDTTRFTAHHELGDVQVELGQFESAWQNCNEAWELAERAAGLDDDDPETILRRALVATLIGKLKLRGNELDGAMWAFKRGLELSEALIWLSSDNPRYAQKFLASCSALAALQIKVGDLDAAEASYERAAAFARRLADGNPASIEHSLGNLAVHVSLAGVLLSRHRIDADERAYEILLSTQAALDALERSGGTVGHESYRDEIRRRLRNNLNTVLKRDIRTAVVPQVE